MEEKKCIGTCDREQQTCIPFFVAENQVMHMDKTNKRMLVALLGISTAQYNKQEPPDNL